MKTIATILLAAAAILFGPAATCRAADEAASVVTIKSWKGDQVDLHEAPRGPVVERRAAADLPTGQAEKAGLGWLKVNVGGKDYFVAASQARTDLRLSGRPKCDRLKSATGFAAARGYGEEGCEP